MTPENIYKYNKLVNIGSDIPVRDKILSINKLDVQNWNLATSFNLSYKKPKLVIEHIPTVDEVSEIACDKINVDGYIKLIEQCKILLNDKKLNPISAMGWLFFGFDDFKNKTIKVNTPYLKYNFASENIVDITQMWKVFINLNTACLLKVLKICIDVFDKLQIPFYGKILEITNKRNIFDCNEPRLLFYFYNIEFMQKFVVLLAKQKYIDVLSCDIKNNPKRVLKVSDQSYEVVQEGPSFTRKYNSLIQYGQSGFSESTRRTIAHMDDVIDNEINSYKKLLFARYDEKYADNQKESEKKKKDLSANLERRKLKVLRCLLNLEYDGENFFKIKGFLDPLENSDITKKRKEINLKVENFGDVTGNFESLLFTHNTNILSMLKILNSDTQSFLKGSQFRHGLDSQYGEVVFVLKPKNYLLKSIFSREQVGDAITDYIYNELWQTEAQYNPVTGNELTDVLLTEAHKYNYRYLDFDKYTYSKKVKDGPSFIPTTPESEEIVLARKYCSRKHDTKKPTWCNIQLHINNDVSLKHVECILIPEFILSNDFNEIIKNDPKFQEILKGTTIADYINKMNKELARKNTIDEKLNFINYSCNKFLIVPNSNNIKKFYSYIANRSKTEDYLKEIIVKYKINTEQVESKITRRITNYFEGSSSYLSVNIDTFKYIEQMYMKILLYHDCFLKESTFDLNKNIERLKSIDADETLSESDELM